MRGTGIRLRYLLHPREEVNRPDLPVLSVYRDHGVVPKDSRSDNFNKTPIDVSRYQVVKAGDLVVNKMKAWQGSIAVSRYSGIVSPDYLVCSVSSDIHGPYLHYLLRSKPLVAEYGKRSKGIRPAQWRLYWEDLADIGVGLPSLEEQRRIASFLDGSVALIDGLISARSSQRDGVEERFFVEISEMLTPGIVGASGNDRAWPWLPEFIPGIPMVRLGYLSKLQAGITVHEGRELGGDVVTRPYLRVANVQAGQVDLSGISEIQVPRAMANRSTLRSGDVLMTEGGDLDKLGRGTVWRGEIPDCLHQNHVFAIRPDRERLDGNYLVLLTQSMHGRCYFESTGSKTTNLASTNSSKIMKFPIPLRGLDSQRRIVRILNASRETTSRLMRAIDTQLTLLAERKQALITAAVTGQIDVTTARGV
ncbi:hypothetical protein GCM10010517_30930 [Streptosporangium fragile]|uniref:Type I restriction modification DNA specificity domain-containing protein n=1 Tax=Streptosporangium fragile TaxID=46186 RepID=A0ABP6ICV5_9ACTN